MVALAGCSSSKESQLTASTTTTTTTPPAPIPGVDGRFLSLGGENLYDAGLYELRLWPVRMDPLTPVRRVSSIGACQSRVIVAAAQAEVGYNDHLQVFSGGRFGPVANLGSPHAFKPTLASDCRMLYFDFIESNGKQEDRVHLWNPSESTDTVIASFPGVGAASWGPNSQIAVVERTPSIQGKEQEDLAVHILKSGTRRSLPPPAPRLSSLFWGPANWMAFGNGNEDGTIFLQPDSGERHDLAGWAPRAWSPDGKRLLVAGAERRRLGIVELPDFSTVKPLGDAPIPVHDTVWLPAGSDPVGPITTG
ncbi:MAG: hypothetical protein ACRDYF_13440 [Acidimicrobiia bacterium]